MIDRFKDDRAFELLAEDMFKQKTKEEKDKALDCLLEYVDKNSSSGGFCGPAEPLKKIMAEMKQANTAKPEPDGMQEAIDAVVEATKDMPYNSATKSVNIPFMSPKKYPELLKAMGQGFVITNSIPKDDRLTIEIQRG